jgi:hypothetical protein
MSDQHSPGPWLYTAPDSFVHMQYGSWLICKRPPKIQCTPKQWQANARLIAAAPDLLKALQAYVADCKSFDPDDLFAGETLIAARAAIAKATGGAK